LALSLFIFYIAFLGFILLISWFCDLFYYINAAICINVFDPSIKSSNAPVAFLTDLLN